MVTFDCSSQEITDVEALKDYEHLRNLSLQVNSIESLDPLKALKYIINLNVSENKLTNLECFDEAVLPHCRSLDCSKNASLASIGKLQLGRLKSANFRGCGITSLESFGGHELLEELDLGENALSTCAGVANMPALTSLKLDNNSLTSIEGIADLPKVTSLELQDQKKVVQTVTEDEGDVEKEVPMTLSRDALKGCPEVVKVTISNCNVVTAEIWNLQELPKLRDLVAEGTPAEKIETLMTIERLTSFNGEAITDDDRTAAQEMAAAKKQAEEEAAATAAAEAGGDDA
jgi:Leucine-rich repeat (LRR) protein